MCLKLDARSIFYSLWSLQSKIFLKQHWYQLTEEKTEAQGEATLHGNGWLEIWTKSLKCHSGAVSLNHTMLQRRETCLAMLALYANTKVNFPNFTTWPRAAELYQLLCFQQAGIKGRACYMNDHRACLVSGCVAASETLAWIPTAIL